MSVADEIKSKLDIVQYISRTVPLKRAGSGRWKACCPFHSEKTPSFVVDENRQSWRCFGACATGGDIFNYAMKQHGWNFHEALEELAKLAGIDLRPQSPEARARHEALDRQRGLMKITADFFQEQLFNKNDPLARETLEYARRKRGLTDETIQRFGIGFAPPSWRTALDALMALGYSEDDLLQTGIASRSDNGRVYDRFRNRLMIPIRDERGRVVGFGARALAAEDNPKYLNSPQSPLFDKSRILFGLDLAARAIRDTETAVIVEGYLDAIQAHQAGYQNVVAQMGTALTEMQLKLIAPKWAKRIIMALDSDAAGQNATRRSVDVARETLHADYGGRLSVDIRILALPGAKDPDDLIREAPESWAALVDGAIPVADFLIAAEMAALPDGATLQEREAAARRLLPILLASENDLYKKDNLQRLALKLHIAERDLMVWAADQQRSDPAMRPPAARVDIPEPPDFPPLELDFDADTSDDLPDFDSPRATRRAPVSAGQSQMRDAALEAYCLRVLFSQPDLFYHVNRKFHELAGDDPLLQGGALSDLSPDDFTRSSYRALMMTFVNALAQDEVAFPEFIQAQLQPDLLEELTMILADHWEELRPRLRHGLSADLVICLKQSERMTGSLDLSAELIEKALRLRGARLQRERQELAFLHMEGSDIGSQISVSIMAKRLIDAELNRRAQLQRG